MPRLHRMIDFLFSYPLEKIYIITFRPENNVIQSNFKT